MNSPYRLRPRGLRGTLRVVLQCVALLGVSIGAADVGAVDLTDVEFAAQPGNRVEIQLLFSGPVSAPQTFDTVSPARIALDFEGVANRLERRAVPIGVGPVHSLVAVEASDRARVVINLNDSVPYRVTTEGNRVRVDIDARSEPEAAPAPSPASAAARAQPRAPASAPWDRPASDGGSAPGPSVRDIDFRRGPEGEGRVLITLPSATTRVTVREQGSRVLVDVIDAALPQRLFRRLDVVDFATPVVAIESRPKGRNVEVNVQTGSDFEYMAYQTDNLFTLELRPLTSAEKERLAREKVVYDGERLSLNFQDIEVRAVLQLLADFTDLNLVASDSVGGNITLRLKNVPWDQALDIILKTKNLTKRQEGNVIMVGPFDEIVGHEERTLTADQRLEELAPIRSEFIPVKFAKAAEIAAFIRGASSLQSTARAQSGLGATGRDARQFDRTVSESTKDSILTPGRGSVTFDERTNTLLVMDTSARLDQIREIVARLDIPVRQVMIESRVVIANNDFTRDLGVRFGLATSMGALYNNEMLIGGGLPGNLTGRGNYDAGPFGLNTAGEPNNSIILNPVATDTPSLLVNLPAADPSGAVNFLIGKVGSYLLQLELSAMQREGRGEVISSPRVITSDQKEARIEVGKKIPYSTTSQDGTNVQFENATLSLTVTPAITPDDRIIMDLVVTKDEPDFSRVVDGTPTINTREIETRVLVDNGETVVLGGVYERTKIFAKEQVPWLGDVPVLGRLFKQEAREDNNSELLIFVTPKILKGDLIGN
ncbi:type IV pilus secretin PilQ [Thiocapsa bogorovii]|uniref:type IV pilus secretin PilQ n=1 Tax=Thiocapsa bogorovii TaxID=521689 RepID=UPI001E633B53|nr:type IV pilus secretin PilQ [Thiocapsa bogorovii]UHD14223.1 type IV pilus secretin PilQ [Thiocapsa bogorovii]